jgi:hypothetical protein
MAPKFMIGSGPGITRDQNRRDSVRFMLARDDPRNVDNLRLQTAALCSKLSGVATRLRDGSLDVADLRADFERRFQPDAIRLADAMRECLASGDSCLIPVSDRINIGEPLLENPQIAAAQLEMIVSILRRALFFTERALVPFRASNSASAEI